VAVNQGALTVWGCWSFVVGPLFCFWLLVSYFFNFFLYIRWWQKSKSSNTIKANKLIPAKIKVSMAPTWGTHWICEWTFLPCLRQVMNLWMNFPHLPSSSDDGNGTSLYNFLNLICMKLYMNVPSFLISDLTTLDKWDFETRLPKILPNWNEIEERMIIIASIFRTKGINNSILNPSVHNM